MLRETRTSDDVTDRDCLTLDGLVPLDQVLALAAFEPTALDPRQVRSIILGEHAKIRLLLAHLESDATELLACALPKSTERHALRQRALALCDQMTAHVGFENQVLVPVVAAGDAWGPLRAQTILTEHAEQLRLLRAYADMLAGDSESSQAIALTVWQLVQSIGEDMRDEEAGVLSIELLTDHLGQNVETG